MTSEVEERPRFVTGGYGRHRSHWVKQIILFVICFSFLYQLLGGSRTSVNDLKEFAARQQQEIAAKEKELRARQVQVMEMKRKSQSKPQNPYLQQLSAKADEQDKRLKELRNVQDQVDSYKLSNSVLGRS